MEGKEGGEEREKMRDVRATGDPWLVPLVGQQDTGDPWLVPLIGQQDTHPHRSKQIESSL